MPRIKPKVELVTFTASPEKHIELCGRSCYDSLAFMHPDPIIEIRGVQDKDMPWRELDFPKKFVKKIRKSRQYDSTMIYLKWPFERAAAGVDEDGVVSPEIREKIFWEDFQKDAGEGVKAKFARLNYTVWPSSAELFIDNVINRHGHISILDHASMSFLVTCSRACSHQIVRHRVGAGYSQTSQRYVKMEDFDYIVPPTVKGEALDLFDAEMKRVQESYMALLNQKVPKEDARFVLPNACATRLAITYNFTALINFLHKRLDEHAQWEIQDIARGMLLHAKRAAPTVFEKFDL